jgi:hypothetical protein
MAGLGAGFPSLNCVDMSRWGGELTRSEAEEMWALGIRHIIVGTGNPGGAGLWARQQAAMWFEVNATRGGTADAYIYLYFAGEASVQVRQGVDALKGLPIRMWWLDAEDVDPACQAMSPSGRTRFLQQCEDACYALNLVTGMYSGGWWWRSYLPGYTGFSHLPLWNSYYDGDPDEDGINYGGWEHSAIEQYNGTTTVAGQSVDLNYAKNLGTETDMALTQEQFDNLFTDAMSRWLPLFLKDAFENVEGAFGDRPDIGMDFPYKPWLQDATINAIDHSGECVKAVRDALTKALV